MNICALVSYILIILLISFSFKQIYLYFNSRENFKSSNCEFVLYYVDWCPFCKELIKVKGEKKLKVWNKLENYLNNNTINGKEVKCYSINCENNKCKNVKGYPTIKLKKNGKEKIYKGDRDYDSFISFLKSECS
tara:strand:+ start:2411 stop:2812 length:402 start_codon:yes stop_codon:yes gene_type:complete